MRNHRGGVRRGIGFATAAVGLLVSAGAVTAGGQASYHGEFHETAAGAGLGYDIHGSAKMTVGPSSTVVKINVSGLNPALEYTSHLHILPCADPTVGGVHYKNDPNGLSTHGNELWLSNSGTKLRSNPGGVAHATGSVGWMARTSGSTTNARSVVVHQPGGVKIACADLG